MRRWPGKVVDRGHPAVRVLAISGSLRSASSNTAVVRAARLVAPAHVEVTIYRGLATLPPFNPDEDGDTVPASIADLRAQVAASDSVLICSPEYAHGVPGVLKNALDWLVGGIEMVDKPVALVNASSRATIAQAQLAETLTTMNARIITAASITLPLTGRTIDEFGIAADQNLSSQLRRALAVLAALKPSASPAIS